MQGFAETLKPAAEPAPVVTTPEPVTEVDKASPAITDTEAQSAQEPVETGEPKVKSEKDGQLAAVIAERKRRQKAEAELRYYQGLAEGRAPKEEKPKGPTKEDLENEYLLDPRGTTQRIVQEHIQNAIFDDRLARSMAAMRREAKDYDALIEKHSELVPDAALMQQIRQHPEPARFVYEYLKAQERLAAVNQDPAEYEKKLRAEIEAKVRKELALKEAAETPTTPANGPAGGATPAGSAPTVEELFAKRRNRTK